MNERIPSKAIASVPFSHACKMEQFLNIRYDTYYLPQIIIKYNPRFELEKNSSLIMMPFTTTTHL